MGPCRAHAGCGGPVINWIMDIVQVHAAHVTCYLSCPHRGFGFDRCPSTFPCFELGHGTLLLDVEVVKASDRRLKLQMQLLVDLCEDAHEKALADEEGQV